MQSEGKMKTESKMCKMQNEEICTTALSKRPTDISYTPGPEFPSVT